MIHDVDRSLTTWLGRCLPAGTAVRFTSPRPEWLTRPPEPVLLNGFLYDIREDVSLLASDVVALRDTDGQTTARRAPTRHYRLRYLLTAWVADNEPLTEHELLAAVLRGAVADLTIPADCLAGSLVEAGELVPMRCAPAGEKPAGVDMWAACGLPPRTTLDLVVTAPLVPLAITDLAPAPSAIDMNTERPGSLGRPETVAAARERPRGRITERP